MRFHEVAAEIEHILGTAVDQSTGEISDETAQALDALELERSQRALDLAVYALGLERESLAISTRAEELDARAELLSRKAASLLAYVERNITTGEKLADDRASIGWRKSTRVEIEDAARIPDCFQREIPRRWEPDKAAIKEAIVRGESVEGASLVTHNKMVVR